MRQILEFPWKDIPLRQQRPPREFHCEYSLIHTLHRPKRAYVTSKRNHPLVARENFVRVAENPSQSLASRSKRLSMTACGPATNRCSTGSILPLSIKLRRKQRRNVLHIAGTHGPIELLHDCDN